MKLVILILSILIRTSVQEVLDQKCFEDFMASRNDTKCNYEAAKIVKKQLDRVFEEIYGNLPVNGFCEKTTREEFNLIFSVLHVSRENLHQKDKREIFEKLDELFRLILSKILTCYDSEIFFKKCSLFYERLEDETIKNCIVQIANNKTLDGKCSKLMEVICKRFYIDEIFLETSNFTEIESLINDTENCFNMTNKSKNVVQVLRGVQGGNQEEFDNYYIQFIKNILNCLNRRKTFIPIVIQGEISNNQIVEFNASTFFQFLVSVNYFLVLFFIFLLFLLFFASIERKERYRYMRI